MSNRDISVVGGSFIFALIVGKLLFNTSFMIDLNPFIHLVGFLVMWIIISVLLDLNMPGTSLIKTISTKDIVNLQDEAKRNPIVRKAVTELIKIAACGVVIYFAGRYVIATYGRESGVFEGLRWLTGIMILYLAVWFFLIPIMAIFGSLGHFFLWLYPAVALVIVLAVYIIAACVWIGTITISVGIKDWQSGILTFVAGSGLCLLIFYPIRRAWEIGKFSKKLKKAQDEMSKAYNASNWSTDADINQHLNGGN